MTVAVDTGRGVGSAVVRKWTNENYARLRQLEEELRSRLRREAARWCFGCDVGHPMEMHLAGEADRLALRIAAERYDLRPYGAAGGLNAFMRATGNNAFWRRLTGLGTQPTLYDNANARLGVGDSTVAVSVTQTDLQAAANKIRKGMMAGYPSIQASPNDDKIDLRSDFVSGEAEFTWIEFGTFNARTGAGMFNRGLFSPSPGIKGGGVTWTLTETLTNT